MSNDSECCKNCRFFEGEVDEDFDIYDGYCRRFPPVYISNSQGEEHFSQPLVMADITWCGEYQPIVDVTQAGNNT